jgi:hypothetical protein
MTLNIETIRIMKLSIFTIKMTKSAVCFNSPIMLRIVKLSTLMVIVVMLKVIVVID